MSLITITHLETKPGETSLWFADSAPKGAGRFYARITPTGKRLFYFKYTNPSGKREYITLGAYDPKGKKGLTLAQARSKAGELSRLYQGGVTDVKGYLEAQRTAEEARLAAERRAAEVEASRMTVRELFERWAELKLSKRKDEKELRRSFEKDVFPAIGHLPAHAVRKGNILTITDRIENRGANRIARIVFVHLRALFGYAVAREYIEVDPTANITEEIGEKAAERDRTLSDDEIRLLVKQLPSAGFVPTTEAAIWIALATCCRVGELLKAKWSHIDFENRRWLIPAENSKNTVPIEIYLSDFALKQFRILEKERKRPRKKQKPEDQERRNEWLYPARNRDKGNTHISVKTVTKQIGDRQKPKIKTKGTTNQQTLVLPGGLWHMHDLRRTAATIMGDLGIRPEVIDRCLNHKEPNKVRRTYQRYLYQPEMKEAWKKLGERLEGLTSGQKVAEVIPLRIASNDRHN